VDTALPQLFYSSVISALLEDRALFDSSQANPTIVLPSSTCKDFRLLRCVGALIGKALFDGYRVSAERRLALTLFTFLAAPVAATPSSKGRNVSSKSGWWSACISDSDGDHVAARTQTRVYAVGVSETRAPQFNRARFAPDPGYGDFISIGNKVWTSALPCGDFWVTNGPDERPLAKQK
jgi:hypothetical protein